ncbi:histidine kinase [Umezawaea sp. Da 62-37]|uniref:sensor histidine kinase n=1 Tax=Umezawaea sp. Da 62-37 TaxID=3075927 RepID=UPI0028F72CA6|nr:histidine kinase [Umezawaea sp. Da 62-37]WNV87846.1 histidine kinase [Umezawaea sp. Da 62-37]
MSSSVEPPVRREIARTPGADRVSRWLPHEQVGATTPVRGAIRDVWPVLAVALLGLVTLRDTGITAPLWLVVLVVVVPLLPALGRHRRPVPAFLGTAACAVAAFAALGLSGNELTVPVLALTVCLVTVVDREPDRVAVPAATLCALFGAATLLTPAPSVPGASKPVYALVALTGAAVLLGRNRRARRVVLAGLRERAETAERTRDALALAAVAEERRYIAREVHDIVSHNIAVMTNLADGAAVALRRNAKPLAALTAVEAIAGTGREAMEEMHALLGVLRDPGERDEPTRPPAPGIEQLPALVEQVRAAGLDVALVGLGESRPVGGGTSLTAYRLVQEALSNSLRHAREVRRAVVTLRWSTDQLVLEVVDDGASPGAPPVGTGGGHGLIGMRERVLAHGGTITAGPGSTSGWRVTAHLPLATPRVGSPA